MKYFVFDNANNKYEALTKEEVLSAIVQAVETHEIGDVDTGFVTKLKEGNKNIQMSVWIGTTAEYNAIEEKETNCLYILTDDTELEDLQSEINDLNTAVEAVQQGITDVDTQVGTLAQTVSEAVSTVNTVESEVEEMQDDVGDLQTDMTAAQSAISTAQGNITTLQGNVTDLNRDMSTLSSKVNSLDSEVDLIGGAQTQLRTDVNLLQDDMIDLLPVVRKYNQLMLNQQVPSSQVDVVSIPLSGTYKIEDFNIVKVQFVDNVAFNKEVLCNVYHNGNTTRITGSYFDIEALQFYSICLVVNENTNILTQNKSLILDQTDWSQTNLPINKIIGVA